ncbi:phage tail protein [Pseudomonas sp. RIT411]|uniref:phage tail protein n=1 Tax=Pseudomonas sp. RIT411 TaxID=2202160 RepID=UPI000D37712C|nr:phage tail protein [Pseudomonas sp. RIT 411]RAU39257.1 phage tail protein [Pseudomonas sp. RIT 411]
MGYKLPNGATFQMASTYGPAVAISAISNASEAIATIGSGAAIATGDIVLLTSGWTQLNGRVARVKAVNSTAVTLEGIDTTNPAGFPAGGGVGSMKKITAWVVIPQITEVAFAGGEQQYTDVVFLEDTQGRQLPTDKSAASMTLTIADDPVQACVPVLKAADANQQVEAARLNLPGNDALFYGAFISYSKQPVVARSQILTRTVGLALQAEPTRYSTAAV